MDIKKKKVVKRRTVNHLKKIVAEFSERIDKGVRFLDRRLGRKVWLQRIDEQKLNLQKSNICMLGQAYGDFWNSLGVLKITEEKSCAMGFLLDDDIDGFPQSPHGFDGYDILTHLWHCRVVGLKINAGMALAEIGEESI